MKYLRILILIKILLFIYSCATVKEGFTNQKKTSSDEFLVEKKSPLILPPDYKKLPLPENLENEANLNKNKIKELVSNNNQTNEKINSSNQNIEESLIKKIKKK